MAGYEELPLSVNPTATIEAIYAELEEKIPGWTPAPGNLEDFIISACVYRLFAPLAQLAVSIPNELFQRFGEQVVNVPPLEAVRATVNSTWKMVDSAGYTILAGTVVNVPLNGGESVGFRVVSNVSIEAGKSEGEVQLEAVLAGPEGNGLSGVASLAESLGYISSITLVGESSGGQEAEEPTAYLERLTAEMQTLGPHPVIARDVEILARNVPGVARALALDNYDPETNPPEEPEKWTSEKVTTVVVCNSAGAACTLAEKLAVQAELAAKREVNFQFLVADPGVKKEAKPETEHPGIIKPSSSEHTKINIHVEVVPVEGFSQAEANAAAIAALTALVSPENWGRGSQGTATAWGNQTILRYQDLVTAVNNQQQIDHYSVLKVAIEGSERKTEDITLKGAGPLPEPGKIEIGS